jgi:hypothetical protein|uniref:Uncharacterized protein n=1 Tax=viral metagenome TaxID=1070528 RepID=A0A6C0LU55_9ZZZZ
MNKIYSMKNGVCIRNDDRNTEINNRIFARNLTEKPLEPVYDIRATPTKYVKMPVVNIRREMNETQANYPIYNGDKQFYPGNSKAPWSGFANNVDLETKLHNTTFALQKCDQREYIPSTTSNMYSYPMSDLPAPLQHGLLFHVPEIKTDVKEFNDNDVFNNSTRSQRNIFKGK